jgi:hypothetical protein
MTSYSPKEAPKSLTSAILSEEQIKEFQTIYKNYYGKEINRDEAYEQGAKLIQLIEIIYKPMTKEQFQRVEKHIEEIKNPSTTVKLSQKH